MRRLHLAAVTLVVTAFFNLAMAATLFAAVTAWNTDASGDWTTPSNWSGGAVPGAADDVTINRASVNPTVTLSFASHRS